MNSLHNFLISTQHADLEDFPWIPMGAKGMEVRMLQVRPEDKLMVTHFRAAPGTRSTPHLHHGPTLGFTTKGAWGHHPTDFQYRPNSYISEPLREMHQFFNGPDTSEVYFVTLGDIEYFDDDAREVIMRIDPEMRLAQYYQKCEELGFKRPNVMR